jgi:hypothetical protein
MMMIKSREENGGGDVMHTQVIEIAYESVAGKPESPIIRRSSDMGR